MEENYGYSDNGDEVICVEKILALYEDTENYNIELISKVGNEDEDHIGRKKRSRKRAGRRGGRGERKSKENIEIKILQNNCDGYTLYIKKGEH